MNPKKLILPLVFLIFSCSSPYRKDRISSYDNSFHNHNNNDFTVVKKFEFKTSIFSKKEVIESSTPLLINNVLYVFGKNTFYKININNGKIIFKKELPFKIIGNINLTNNDKLIFYASDGNIYLTDKNINIYKKYPLFGEEVKGNYKILNNSIFFKTSKDRLYSLNKDTLELNWVTKPYISDFFPIISEISGITTDNQGNIITGFSNGKIVILSLKDGKTLYEENITSNESFNDITSFVTLKDNAFFIPSLKSGIIKINAENKIKQWETKKEAISELFVINKKGYYFSSDSLNEISLENGQIIKSYEFQINNPVKFFQKKNHIFAVSQDDGLYIFDIKNKKVNKITVSSGITATPLIKDNKLIIFSNNSVLYILKFNNS